MSKFTEAEKETAIRALVQAGGNVSRASSYLQSRGLDVSERSLRDYKNSERYEELADNSDWKVEEQAVSAEGIVSLADELQVRYLQAALRRSDEELDKMTPNSLMLTARGAAVVKGVNFDKAADARGRPKRPEEDRSVGEILRFLSNPKFKAALPGLADSPLLKEAIDSTAEEID